MVSQNNGAGTAAGVMGIVAVVLMWIPFVDFIAIILGVLAVIMGTIGINRANRTPGLGKGMAITGVVCGIVAIVVSVLFVIAVYGWVLGLHRTVSTSP